LTVYFALFKVYVGKGGWLKTSVYRHMRGGRLKLLKKPLYDIWTFAKCAKNVFFLLSFLRQINRWGGGRYRSVWTNK